MSYLKLTSIKYLLVISALWGCDSAPQDDCLPNELGSELRTGSVAARSIDECRISTAAPIAGVAIYSRGGNDGRETFVINVHGTPGEGPGVDLVFDGATPPNLGTYPVVDVRDNEGLVPLWPVQFHRDSVYSAAFNGAGEGYWFSTGGTLTIQSVDENTISGEFDVRYIHGSSSELTRIIGNFRSSPNS